MHWWIPKRQRRYTGAAEADVLPFHSQNVVLRLYPLERTVRPAKNVKTVGESVKVKEAASEL